MRAYSSPMLRARRTAELAGFAAPELTPLLSEFDYGEYEGVTSREIHRRRPGWDVYRDGCPGGETPAQVYERAGRFVELALGAGGDVVAFAHGHILRAVAVAFVGAEIRLASHLGMDTASISILRSGDHGRMVQLWNSR